MSTERGAKNTILAKIISKSDASTSTTENDFGDGEKNDVLARLGIADATVLDEKILTPKKLSQVRFNETRPRGFSMQQVDKFHSAVTSSVKNLIRVIESRDRDVVRLATEIDKYIVDLQNLQNQLDVYESVGGVPLKGHDGEYLTKKDASDVELRVAALQRDKADMEHTITALRSQVGQLNSLLEATDEDASTEDKINEYKQAASEVNKEVIRLRTRVRELETQLFNQSGYELVIPENDATNKIKRPSVELYEALDQDDAEGVSESDGDTITLDRQAYETERAATEKWAEDVNKAFAEMEKQLDEASKALKDSQDESESLAKTVSEMEVAVEDRDSELEEIRSKLSEFSGQTASLKNAVDGFQQQVSDKDTEILKRDETIRDLRTESQNWEREAEKLRAKSNALEESLRGSNDTIAKLAGDNESLSSQISMIQSLLTGTLTSPVTPAAQEEISTTNHDGEVAEGEPDNSKNDTQLEVNVEDSKDIEDEAQHEGYVEIRPEEDTEEPEAGDDEQESDNNPELPEDDDDTNPVDAPLTSVEDGEANLLDGEYEDISDDSDFIPVEDGSRHRDDQLFSGDTGFNQEDDVDVLTSDNESTFEDYIAESVHDSELVDEVNEVIVTTPVQDQNEDVFVAPQSDNDDDDMFSERPSSSADIYDDEDEGDDENDDANEGVGDEYYEDDNVDTQENEEFDDDLASDNLNQSNNYGLSLAELYGDDGELDESKIDLERMNFNVDDDSRYDVPDDQNTLTKDDFKEDDTVYVVNGRKLPPGIRPEDL